MSKRRPANLNSTKEGVMVRIGQVWRDLDKRMTGRLVAVIRLGNGFAYVRPWHPKVPVYGRITRIAIARMYQHSTGFQLVSEADSVSDAPQTPCSSVKP